MTGIDVRLGKNVKDVSALWVKRIVLKTLVSENKKSAAVSVLLTDNRKIRQINKKFLGHDYATDVISFGASSPRMPMESGFLCDLVVSVEMAKRMAAELAISFEEELARYLVHGTLHLLGYDDKRPRDKKIMFKKQ